MPAASLIARGDLGGPPNPRPSKDGPEPGIFRCCIEHAAETDHIFSARAGFGDPNHGRPSCLLRWKPGSVVTFAVSRNTFPEKFLSVFERALTVAIDDWNNRNIGVRFKRVANNERAVFKIKYDRTLHGPVYAKAFFPNFEKRTLRVSNAALSATSHGFLSNILRHELGHVLGLRHEDAGTKEKRYPSVELTPPNTRSIMISQFSPEINVRIQESDVAALRQLYTLAESSMFRDSEFEVVSVDSAVAGQARSTYPDKVFRRGADSVSAGTEAAHGHNTINISWFAINLTWFAVSVSFGFILARTWAVGATHSS
ncbi:hypothetical protein MFIFM68171_02530 [Madurella fahalii]|uniref:Peptidase metallopeptidase domain-containing protein n=1 Tax=Madurella fahalii TaxID=1157608 RepID=A0ABQ0G3H6_9PEZI